jgi:hypothetical protein
MRSKAAAQLLSSAHNKVYSLTLYKNVPLPEGQEGTTWEPSNQESVSIPFPNVASLTTPQAFSSLSG